MSEIAHVMPEKARTLLANAHYVDVRIRVNGRYEWVEGDWLKTIARREAQA